MADITESTVDNDYIHISKTDRSPRPEDFVQLIDGDGTFTSDLQEYLRSNNMLDKGTDYSTIAVFGPQSSGKSTLLNRLFDTHFTTMDSKRGRYQVTLGVLCSKAADRDILVLDVEGTDSKERGEDNMSFERKISLFTLAVSEVLIINMWMNDIGRYNASNFALLKTVFELNLQLFLAHRGDLHDQPKTLLLFVIRDHVRETTSLEILQNDIDRDIDKIWDSLTKPKGFEETTVRDFFDIEFTSLPHKILKEDEFEKECLQLKQRFYDESSDEFVFLKRRKKNIPIDGFEHYTSNIWKVIAENKDLDIPTQKEMLAMFRCKEIAREVQAPFLESFSEWNNQLSQDKLIENLGQLAKTVVDRVIDTFRQKTTFYMPKVAELERLELENKLKDQFKSVYSKQIAITKKQEMTRFQQDVSNLIKDSKSIIPDFTAATEAIVQRARESFKNCIAAASYPGENWDLHQTLEAEFEEETSQIVARARHSQLELVVSKHIKEFGAMAHSDVSSLLQVPNVSTLWNSVRQSIRKIDTRSKEALRRDLDAFSVSEAEFEELFKRVSTAIRDSVRSKLKDTAEVGLLQLKMQKIFDEKFLYSEGRIPRVWRRVEDINVAFKDARSAALKFLDAFFLMRLDESLDNVHLSFPTPADTDTPAQLSLVYPSTEELGNEENVLLDRQECERCYESFCLKAEMSLTEAQRQHMSQSSQARVPWWIVVLIIVLGWNEFMYILSRPVWILVFVIIGALFFWNFIENQLDDYIRDGHPQIVLLLRFILPYLPAGIFPRRGSHSQEDGGGSSSSTQSSSTTMATATTTMSRAASADNTTEIELSETSAKRRRIASHE